MIDNTDETTGKSIGISERESEGVAGPYREVSQRDQGAPSAEITGPDENSELEWAKLHVKEEHKPRLVERKTELHCADRVPARKRKSAVRHRTEQGHVTPGSEVPCRNLETVVQELPGSFMERQELMGEQLLTRLNELEYRIDDLEHERDHQVPSRKPALLEEIAK